MVCLGCHPDRYADIFGTLPIAEALVGKGVGLGTALAFMMSVTTLTLFTYHAEKVMKAPLFLLFVGNAACGIVIIGFLMRVLT